MRSHAIDQWRHTVIRERRVAPPSNLRDSLLTRALGLGLRRGELLGLRWQDVDFAGSRLHVRQTAQRLDAQQGLVMGPPKTARSRRTIPLPDFCRDALRRRRAEQLAQRAAVDSWPASDLVFTTRLGTVIEPSNLRRSSTVPSNRRRSAESASTTSDTPAHRCCSRRVFRFGS